MTEVSTDCELAKSFYYEGNERAIFIIHGLTDSPYRAHEFAASLNSELSISAFGVLLSGHGTSVEDLARYSVSDWRSDCQRGLNFLLEKKVEKIYVVGFSIGGLLGLELASKYPALITKVICIDAPFRIKHQKAISIATSIFRPIIRHYPKLNYRKLPEHKRQELARAGIYTEIPLKKTPEIIRYVEKSFDYLPLVKSDLLIMQGRKSRVIDNNSGKEIIKRVGSVNKEIIYLNHRHHLLDLDMKEVFYNVRKFICKDVTSFKNLDSTTIDHNCRIPLALSHELAGDPEEFKASII